VIILLGLVHISATFLLFDALTSRRTYRTKSSAEEAIEYIKEHSGILFDPLIVEALTRLPYKEFTEGEKIIA